MATGATQSSTHPTATPGGSGGMVEYDKYIEDQLNKTRSQVKLVDLAAAGMLLVAGMVGYLLVIAIIDHWIVTLGFWARLAALTGLIGGSVWFVVAVIVPLILGRVNPVYAARSIEQNSPSLKNSLINLLMLRGDRRQVLEVVYQGLQRQAATGLSSVSIEAAVDRSRLVKIGYCLAALVAVVALYKIASPKDPLQTTARVMAPWADIAAPSRVQIEEVTPGDKQIFQGQVLEVSAVVRGTRDEEPVTLVYSTIDGQAIDVPVALVRPEGELRYRGTLDTTGYGIQQDLIYRLVAGDATSRDYRVEVLPAPSIVVEKIVYEFPRYTGRKSETVERGADIKAIEGTRVTLHAKANRPIKSAYLEFDPDTSPEPGATGDAERHIVHVRKLAGDRAEVSFTLELGPDRRTPQYNSYQMRFMTEEGFRNQQPIQHLIEVLPDLSPLVFILTPEQQKIEVPLDGEQEIRVRAADPDFALRRIRLRGVSNGADALDETLLDDPQGHRGQKVVSFGFRPAKHKLQVGDEIQYWAIAEDNRTAPRTGDAAPNTTRTEPNYRIVVTPPTRPTPAGAQEKSEDQAGNSSPEGNDQDKSPEENSPQSKDSAGDKGDEQGGDDKGGDPKGGDSDSSESKEGGEGDSENQQGTSGSQKADSGKDPQDGESGEGDGGGQQASDPGDAPKQDGAGQGGSGQEAGDQPPGDSRQTNDGTGGKGTPNENANQQPNQNPGASNGGTGGKPSENQQGSSPDGSPPQRGGEGVADSEAEGRPLNPEDGADDGDIFEQIQKHRREQGETGSSRPSDRQGDPGSDSQAKPGQQQQPSADKPADDAAGSDAQGAQRPDGAAGEPNNSPSGGQPGNSAGEQPAGQKPPGDPSSQDPAGGKPDASNGATGSDAGQKKGDAETNPTADAGSGGDPQGEENPQSENPTAGQPQGNPEQRPGQGDSGKSGAGQESGSKTGSPEAQGDNKERDKNMQPGEQSSDKEGEDAKSPSNSDNQSDSQGQESGDRSGGGKAGGGQSSKQAGNDSAGSTSAGDQGAGAAQEQGDGETGADAGNKQPAAGQTGQAGSEAGNGSSSKADSQGNPQPGDSPSQSPQQPQQSPSGNQSPRDPAAQQPTQGESGEGSPGQRGTRPSGKGRPTGGNGGENVATPNLPEGPEPGEDPANLEYARQATDLVLDYLKDQQEQPDPKLLDKLGWTAEDMRKFIARWEQMQRAAKQSGPAGNAAKRQLDETLRSLGLRPQSDQLRAAAAKDDTQQGLRDSTRTRPPSGYLDQYRAYIKGLSRVREE